MQTFSTDAMVDPNVTGIRVHESACLSRLTVRHELVRSRTACVGCRIRQKLKPPRRIVEWDMPPGVQPMKATVIAAAICVLGAVSSAAPSRKLTWKFEGYSQLPAAAAEAHRTRRRLLVGLSGSGT